MRRNYFNLSNFLDVTLYVLSILYSMDFKIKSDEPNCEDGLVSTYYRYIDLVIDMTLIGNFSFQCWQMPIGSFILTISWLNLLSYFRQLPFFGIHLPIFSTL